MKKQKRRETKFRRDGRRKISRDKIMGDKESAEKKKKWGTGSRKNRRRKIEGMRDEKLELECESQKRRKATKKQNMKRKIKPVCNRPIRKYLGDFIEKRKGVKVQGFPPKHYPQTVFWTAHSFPYFSVHV